MTNRVTARLVRFLPLAILAAGLWTAGCKSETTVKRTLTWQDEFDGPAGQLPNESRWRYDVGGSGWGNNQLEYDTARPENVSLDGAGHLAIVARRENYQGREYTSARINTAGLFDQQDGRFEARIRMPVGQGIWPAFWLLGSNFSTVDWPACGEIDIMECRGQEPRVIYGSLHGPGYSGGNAISRAFALGSNKSFGDDFHIFAVEWDSDRITFSVDDTPYQSVTLRDIPAGGRWVFDHPFFIILNVAVGGNFLGPPDAGTVFPQTMLVDWVRVYRLDS